MIYTRVSIPSTAKDIGKQKPSLSRSELSPNANDCAKAFVFGADKAPRMEQTPPKSDKTADDREATPKQASDLPPHQPEIVMTEAKEAPPRQAFSQDDSVRAVWEHTLFERLLPLSGKIALLAALCMISFLFGCTLTDRKLCRVMIAVSTAASGRIPDTPLQNTYADIVGVAATEHTGSSESGVTYYRKYSTASDNIPSTSDIPDSFDSLDYLAAHDRAAASAENDVATAEDADRSAVPVRQNENGKIGADSEILYPVISNDLRADPLFSLSNETRFSPDVSGLWQATPAALQNLTLDGKPLVLIVHTHGTEGYNECVQEGYYDASLPVRSEDISQNVVSVGSALAEVLGDFGIATIHDTTMCDQASFVRAYKTSAAIVRSYLEQYPSLRFVIDLHRDAIVSSDGTSTAPTFWYAGEKAAQLMLVVGTDDAGAAHPHWSDNLSLALHLQRQLSEEYPGLFRKINLRSASFNQQLSNGYLLLECGSIANSRKEALRAVKLFGTGFARMILQAAK